jgi:carboxypeptidase PM20D1
MCRKRGGELNAMMRTTCAFTMMEGSNAMNVIPPVAKMRANIRLIGGDTSESAIEYLKSVVANPDVRFRAVYAMNPSPQSKTDGHHWELLKNAISRTYPEALASPYLMLACTDSRQYCRISDHVYRFSAMELSKEEHGTVHGNNERIPVATAAKTAQFYLRLMRQC